MAEITVSDDSEQIAVDAFIVKRVDRILKIGFQPDWTAEERAGVIEEYRRALRHHPQWVLSKAFDRSVASCANRPTPGNINSAAMSITKDHRNELARRQRIQQADERSAAERRRELPNPDEAAKILADAGFTAKRAAALSARPLIGSFAEADELGDTPVRSHWAKGEAADSPRMQALRKARDQNELIRSAREASV